MSEDLVSVIVPAFNVETYVTDTLRSITGQSYGNLEVLVTDDGSTDRTAEIVRSYGRKDPRVQVEVQSSSGPAMARNRSLQRARGRFAAFCDSDDTWLPEKLEQQLRFMRQHGAAMSFTAYEVVDQDGRSTGRYVDRGGALSVGYGDMLRKRATIGCSTVLVDLSRIPDLRMPDLATGQDYATWLGVLRRGFRAYRLSQPLTRYRIRPGSISRNKISKARRQWQIYRELEQLALPVASWCFLNYAYRAFIRR